MKLTLFAVLLVLCATTVSYAQSMPNYGPNPPSQTDSFGQVPSGAKPPGVPRYGHRSYAYVPHRHHYYRHHHRY
jgi:hypothetical protein